MYCLCNSFKALIFNLIFPLYFFISLTPVKIANFSFPLQLNNYVLSLLFLRDINDILKFIP